MSSPWCRNKLSYLSKEQLFSQKEPFSRVQIYRLTQRSKNSLSRKWLAIHTTNIASTANGIRPHISWSNTERLFAWTALTFTTKWTTTHILSCILKMFLPSTGMITSLSHCKLEVINYCLTYLRITIWVSSVFQWGTSTQHSSGSGDDT